MAKLTQAARNKLPASDFADPQHRRYPMEDPQHRAAAAGFAAMHHKSGDIAKVRAKLKRSKGYGGKPLGS